MCGFVSLAREQDRGTVPLAQHPVGDPEEPSPWLAIAGGDPGAVGGG